MPEALTKKSPKPKPASRKRRGGPKGPGDSLIWRGSVPSSYKKNGKLRTGPHKIEYRVTVIFKNPDIGSRSYKKTMYTEPPDNHGDIAEAIYDQMRSIDDLGMNFTYQQTYSTLTLTPPEAARFIHCFDANDLGGDIVEPGTQPDILPGLSVEVEA